MERHGQVEWPGAISVASCVYTTSQGIAPGIAVITTYPQVNPPDVSGTLKITDNFGSIVMPNCKVDAIEARQDGGGTVWDVRILDRRWRWKDQGEISGTYNQLDPYGKVLPWTEKTPRQLAELCLVAAKERRFRIELPDDPRPAIQWDHVPPMQALSALAESLGCRVIHQWTDDSVIVVPIGDGEFLPDNLPYTSDSPTLDSPERPDKLVVVGQPIRYQARFRLQPVGEDWDGSIRPIDELSYAPAMPANPTIHKVVVTVSEDDTLAIGNVFTVRLDDIEFEFVAASTIGADILAGLKAQIDLAAHLPWRATIVGDTLEITGSQDGTPFETVVFTDDTGGGTPTLTWTLSEQGRSLALSPWAYTTPPTFSGVQATERLLYREAVALAQKSVYRYFRITIEASGDSERGPLRIPEYEGEIVRREQIVLHQTKAQQIEPQEQDDRILDELGRKRKVLFYDGHSRDKPAAVYGAYSHGYTGGKNTPRGSQVLFDFSIDAQRQLVVFSRAVTFTESDGRISPATLVLETGCNVRDAITNALVCFEQGRDFPPPLFGTDPTYIQRDDIQLVVLGIYADDNRLTASLTDHPQARQKADYYLSAYAKHYESVVKQSCTYLGIVPLELDGAIQQITWTIGRPTTTQASRNSEHSPYVKPFKARLVTDAMDAITGGKKGAYMPFTDSKGSGLFDGAPGQAGGGQ